MNLPNKAGYIVRCNIKGNPSGRTHLWTGDDTACRMWSTGGLPSKHKYRFFIAPPSDFCINCHADRHVTEDEQLFALRNDS